MSIYFAGSTFQNTEQIRHATEQCLNEFFYTDYRVFVERSGLHLDVHYVDPIANTTRFWTVPIKDFQQLFLFAKDDAHVCRMLRDYLWTEQKLPVGFNKREGATCTHEWEEKTLFVTVEERCKYCDIKKPSEAS
jgi:hypothetical protein